MSVTFKIQEKWISKSPSISAWSFLTWRFRSSTLSRRASVSRFCCLINPELSFKSLAWLSFSWFYEDVHKWHIFLSNLKWQLAQVSTFKTDVICDSSWSWGMFCWSCSSRVRPCPLHALAGALVWTATETVWTAVRGAGAGPGPWLLTRKPSWWSLSRVSNSSVSSSHMLQWLSEIPYICRKWLVSICSGADRSCSICSWLLLDPSSLYVTGDVSLSSGWRFILITSVSPLSLWVNKSELLSSSGPCLERLYRGNLF